MLKIPLLSLAAAFLAVVCHAQKVGDSEQAVLKALGNPPLSRASGDRITWIYSNGTKVIFRDGVVIEARIGPPEPTAAEDMTAAGKTPQTNVYPTAAATPILPASTTKKVVELRRTVVGLVLAVAAYLLIFICSIIIVIEAFKTSVLWGIASLIIPFAQIVFVATHWSETKKPFLVIWLVGFPLLVVSFMCSASLNP